MASLMDYVEQLASSIGPRPATTDAEERAAHGIGDAFEARGLEAEVQHFDSPRTYSWAYVLYHMLTIGSALLVKLSPWSALLISGVTAIVFWMDLDTRWGLTSLMPKGPSQNVIARHVPKAGRNERVAKVVVVAHYDSARTSLAFSPSMVKNFASTFGLMKACTYAVPVLIAARMLVGGLSFAKVLDPWAWYVTLLPAAYLLVPLVINVHRELFMRYSPGANDNASGVAAMLGVLERIVPEPEVPIALSREAMLPRPRADVDEDSEGMPAGSLLNYAPIAAPSARVDAWSDEGDLSWDTGVISGQTALGLGLPVARTARKEEEREAGPVEPTDEQSLRLFGMSFPTSGRHVSEAAARPARDTDELDFAAGLVEDTAPFDLSAEPTKPEAPGHHGLRDWLGLGGEFDARKKGREIGSWDHFEDEDDSGWKGGAASIDDPEDPGFTTSVVARIRRRVTMNVDRDLVEKEVWFVATGAEEVGTVGMKAFLDAYGHELKDAAIINLDNLGAGAVSYVTREGMAKLYSSDRRLVGAARRVIREDDLPIRGREYRGLSTDATPALARGFRAMSVMAFDINGRLPNWHWTTDVPQNVSEDNLKVAVDLVTGIIREL